MYGNGQNGTYADQIAAATHWHLQWPSSAVRGVQCEGCEGSDTEHQDMRESQTLGLLSPTKIPQNQCYFNT
jgi:hypothetical protein